MHWRPKLIVEHTEATIEKAAVQNGGEEIVYDIRYSISSDELLKAERAGEIRPIEPPIRFNTVSQLLKAIQNDEYVGDITFDDVVRYMIDPNGGMEHMVFTQNAVGPREREVASGIQREDAGKITAAVFYKMKDKITKETGDERKGLAAAQDVAKRIKRLKYYGGDFRAGRGGPGSKSYNEGSDCIKCAGTGQGGTCHGCGGSGKTKSVISSLIDYFVKMSRGPAIAAAKNLFPSGLQNDFFGDNDELVEYDFMSDTEAETEFERGRTREQRSSEEAGHERPRKQFQMLMTCPKCDGVGTVKSYSVDGTTTHICPMCDGEKETVGFQPAMDPDKIKNLEKQMAGVNASFARLTGKEVRKTDSIRRMVFNCKVTVPLGEKFALLFVDGFYSAHENDETFITPWGSQIREKDRTFCRWDTGIEGLNRLIQEVEGMRELVMKLVKSQKLYVKGDSFANIGKMVTIGDSELFFEADAIIRLLSGEDEPQDPEAIDDVEDEDDEVQIPDASGKPLSDAELEQRAADDDYYKKYGVHRVRASDERANTADFEFRTGISKREAGTSTLHNKPLANPALPLSGAYIKTPIAKSSKVSDLERLKRKKIAADLRAEKSRKRKEAQAQINDVLDPEDVNESIKRIASFL